MARRSPHSVIRSPELERWSSRKIFKSPHFLSVACPCTLLAQIVQRHGQQHASPSSVMGLKWQWQNDGMTDLSAALDLMSSTLPLPVLTISDSSKQSAMIESTPIPPTAIHSKYHNSFNNKKYRYSCRKFDRSFWDHRQQHIFNSTSFERDTPNLFWRHRFLENVSHVINLWANWGFAFATPSSGDVGRSNLTQRNS